MGDLSEHFSRHEFSCKCGCGQDTVDYFLVMMLEKIRVVFNRRIFINSGNRCLKYNRKIGSKDTSQHPKGKAADIGVEDIPLKDVADFLEDQFPYCCGIGRYQTFIHVDSRTKKARWSG